MIIQVLPPHFLIASFYNSYLHCSNTYLTLAMVSLLPPYTPTLLVTLLLLLPAQAQAQFCRGDPTITGYCTPLTWIDTTIPTSPAIEQCNNRCSGISNDAGDWMAQFAGKSDAYRDNMVGGPCAFAMSRGSNTTGDLFLHNQDILDLYYGAIERFGGGGRVAARGAMTCQGMKVNWFLG